MAPHTLWLFSAEVPLYAPRVKMFLERSILLTGSRNSAPEPAAACARGKRRSRHTGKACCGSPADRGTARWAPVPAAPALLAKLKVHAEELNGVHKPAQQLHVDPVQRCQLPQQTPPLAPVPVKKVEDEHSQHTGAVVVHHAQRAQHRTRHHHKADTSRYSPVFCFLRTVSIKWMPRMPKSSVQMTFWCNRVEPCTAVHQIEGDFRKQGKQQQTQGVFFQVVGVEVASTAIKAKMGKAKRPAQVSHSCAGSNVAHRWSISISAMARI